MPNHIHLLIRIDRPEIGRPMVAPTISTVVQQMKGIVTKQIGFSILQKSFHDHIIRNEKEPESKKALAILALPVCVSLGVCFGVMLGVIADNIPEGICFGLIGGAVVGMISFGFLYSVLNKNEKKDK